MVGEGVDKSSLVRDTRRREQAPTSLANLCGSCLERMDHAGAVGSTWSAGRAWHTVNGDIERTHTMGIYVREPRGHESLPTLLVYVDSRARATDFSANREVYLARLASVGLRFLDVSFRVSKRPVPIRGSLDEKRHAVESVAPLPELTEEERDRVEWMTKGLPEGLRASVQRAMSASFRAEKARDGA